MSIKSAIQKLFYKGIIEPVTWQPLEGFISWMEKPPSALDIVEITRKEWGHTMVTPVVALPPQMNVYGLYWRPWKGETIANDTFGIIEHQTT